MTLAIKSVFPYFVIFTTTYERKIYLIFFQYLQARQKTNLSKTLLKYNGINKRQKQSDVLKYV